MADGLADRMKKAQARGHEDADEAPEDATGLAARMKELKLRDAAGTDEETVKRAMASKAGLAERMRGAMAANARGPAPAPEPVDDGAPDWLAGPDDGEDGDARSFAQRLKDLQLEEPGERVDLDESPVKSRVMEWFLGREEQIKGSGPVTAIPPIRPGFEEVDFYDVDPPYAFVRIVADRRTGEKVYEAIEPPLTDRDREVLQFVEEALTRGLNADPGRLSEEERADYLARAVRQVLLDYRIRLDTVSQDRIEYYVRRDFLGLGTIHVLMKDPGIEDISCDGPDEPLFVFHRDHEQIPTDVQFEDDADLDGYVIRLAQRSGKAISVSDPILDAALPDGSRLQCTLGHEVTENGSTFTIRRFKPDPFTPIDLLPSAPCRSICWRGSGSSSNTATR